MLRLGYGELGVDFGYGVKVVRYLWKEKGCLALCIGKVCSHVV